MGAQHRLAAITTQHLRKRKHSGAVPFGWIFPYPSHGEVNNLVNLMAF